MEKAWLSYRFEPLEAPNVFLVRGLMPFLQAHIWPVEGRRAFFVRYADDRGEHLRIRLRGEPGVLREAFDEGLSERGEWQPQDYVVEAERFGGSALYPWAEEHFHLSTRVALERLSEPVHVYGDALFDAMVSNVIAAYVAGFNREEARGWFGALYEQWLPLFFRDDAGRAPDPEAVSAIEAPFARSLQQQGADLRDSLHTLWLQLMHERLFRDQPEWLRWLRGNELILPAFGAATNRIASSLLHLHANRLGVNNQDEVFMLYLLHHCL